MKRMYVAALSGALAVAMAAPAFAVDTKVSGFFKTRFMRMNLNTAQVDDAAKNPETLIDQRFRAKIDNTVNEYLSFTYYGEIDMMWGDQSYATSRNRGGGMGGDTVNLETKNLYMTAKIPNSPVTATVGLQGLGDNWDMAFLGQDMAAAKVAAALGPANVTAFWSKWQEGNRGGLGVDNEDDIDLYGVQAAFKPMDDASLGADFYWLNANAMANGTAPLLNNVPNSGDIFYAGLSGQYRMDIAVIKAWAAYNFGSIKDISGGDDFDLGGFGASVKGEFAVNGIQANARVLYFSSDDDLEDDDGTYFSNPAPGEPAPFIGDGLIIMTADSNLCTFGTNGLAMNDAGWTPYGLWGFIVSAGSTLPAMPDVWGKLALGHFRSIEDDVKDANLGNKYGEKEGKNLGTEVAARVGYKIAKNLDVSLNGAYVWLGDFYDAPSGGDNPDNLYQLYLQTNLGF